MEIKIIAIYAKRLGLPGYSSHQFSVSLETELADLSNVRADVNQLYTVLQDAVDQEIQQTGFVPNADYGKIKQSNGNVANWQHQGSGGNRRLQGPALPQNG